MEKSPITVLHIASGDLWAGAEVQLFTLANALKNDTDTIVHVILLNHGRLEKELIDCGVEVTVLDESKNNGLKILRILIIAIKRIRPDVIHSHRSKENILGSIAALLVGNIPTLRTAHGAPEQKPTWFHIPKRLILFLDWFTGRFLQKKIIAVTDDLAGILQDSYPANKIEVIQNGIDAKSLISSVQPKTPIGEFTITSSRIGIAGRLVPVKRVDLFIKAAKILLASHPELQTSFHIFGDGPLRTSLETLNQKQKTENKIHFEGHCENMQQKLLDLDMLVLTSDHEGLPMILLEAMVLQKPIIAHAVGGIPTLLERGKCGVLVSDHQPSAYAEAIYQLIKSSETHTKISMNALARVTTFYSSEKNATAYNTVYSSLIRQRKANK
jgi:glycosyltransferase involved in cell wall biosynthesis